MAGFIQIIEFQTSRIDEIQALTDERSLAQQPGSTVVRVTITADRDRPGYYLTIAEFAAQMAKLCDGPPKFYNLDVHRVMGIGG